MWPQRIYKASSGVTSLDWSKQHPTLLAVGYYDGNIAVYDVRQQDTALPMLDSSQLATKHTGAVWQVKWVQKGASSGSGDSNERGGAAGEGGESKTRQ